MNNVHLHLVFNHLPIIFPLVGFIVLLTGFFTKNETVKRTSFFVFILGAIASVAAMATGENAEEAVEKLPGVTENLINSHEEAAELFALFSYILGGVSLLGVYLSYKNFKFSKIVSYVIVLLTVITLYFAQQAGNTGGQIRHTEIRNTTTVSNNIESTKINEQRENENDD